MLGKPPKPVTTTNAAATGEHESEQEVHESEQKMVAVATLSQREYYDLDLRKNPASWFHGRQLFHCEWLH